MAARMTPWFVAATATALLAAQTPPPAPRLAAIELSTYDEVESRRCFAALDANADDRLNVFELTRGLAEGSEPSDAKLLRSLDLDRDGFVDWAEFDRRVQSALRLHGMFRCHPARTPAVAPPHATKVAVAMDPLIRSLLDLTDADGSDSLSRVEFQALVLSLGLPAAMAEQFAPLDRDQNGALDPSELGPLTPIVSVLMTRRTPPSAGRAFSASWAAADRNRDGAVDAAELELALRRHDVFLGRWAGAVIADADRSGDGKLGPAEVLAEEQRRAREDKAGSHR